MFDQINGLPGHVLLVHAVVVLIPLTCLLLVLAAASPRLRDRIGIVLPVLAAICVALVPLTVSAGRWLEQRIGASPLIEKHEKLGEDLLVYVIALLVLSIVVYGLRFVEQAPARGPATKSSAEPSGHRAANLGAVTVTLPMRLALTLVCLAVAVATVVQVVRVGDSGAKAVWTGVSQNP